jgi:hypothetical protein
VSERPFPELKAATPWLEGKARSFAARRFAGDENVVEHVTRELLELLKESFSEGYADRMKSEVAETRSETPKRTARRKKK